MTPNDKASLSEEAIERQYPDIYNSLMPLLRRSQPGSLDAYLETVACDVNIEQTQTNAHCRFIALDGNKRARVKDFVRFIGKKITDFAIPRGEINRALNEGAKTSSTAPVDKLSKKARNLFTRLPKSGEGGEVLLSILAETILRLPQLFTKMVLKTNANMHVHGSDAIHFGINQSNGSLALYWGESKLYADAGAAIRECFTSLAPFLLGAGGSGAAQERDLQLMRDGIDLDDIKLENALKQYLDPDSTMFKQFEYRGLCLVGFNSEAYPTSPNSPEANQLKQKIETTFDNCKNQIQNRVLAERIETFTIELFCVPFPKVDDFRSAFREELGLPDGQS